MKLIKSTNSELIQVSDEDFDNLNQFHWQVSFGPHGEPRSVSTSIKKKTFQMSHLILRRRGIEFKYFVDHKDSNPLNNQFENLRPACYSQNAMNRRCASGYRGVHKAKNGKYKAQIGFYSRSIHIGTFATAEEAARKYDEFAKLVHKEFAILNFPDAQSCQEFDQKQ